MRVIIRKLDDQVEESDQFILAINPARDQLAMHDGQNTTKSISLSEVESVFVYGGDET